MPQMNTIRPNFKTIGKLPALKFREVILFLAIFAFIPSYNDVLNQNACEFPNIKGRTLDLQRVSESITLAASKTPDIRHVDE